MVPSFAGSAWQAVHRTGDSHKSNSRLVLLDMAITVRTTPPTGRPRTSPAGTAAPVSGVSRGCGQAPVSRLYRLQKSLVLAGHIRSAPRT